jgi:hypothetical protein
MPQVKSGGQRADRDHYLGYTSGGCGSASSSRDREEHLTQRRAASELGDCAGNSASRAECSGQVPNSEAGAGKPIASMFSLNTL